MENFMVVRISQIASILKISEYDEVFRIISN